MQTKDKKDLIERMTQRFLGWRLPENFVPDCGISFEKLPDPPHRHPIGTNLFDADQVRAMIDFMLEGEEILPQALDVADADALGIGIDGIHLHGLCLVGVHKATAVIEVITTLNPSGLKEHLAFIEEENCYAVIAEQSWAREMWGKKTMSDWVKEATIPLLSLLALTHGVPAT